MGKPCIQSEYRGVEQIWKTESYHTNLTRREYYTQIDIQTSIFFASLSIIQFNQFKEINKTNREYMRES